MTVESDFYVIRFDPRRGGIVSSLFAKHLNIELCRDGDRCFHKICGYFIEDKKWRSSIDPATVEVLESGPIRVALSIRGLVGAVPLLRMSA